MRNGDPKLLLHISYKNKMIVLENSVMVLWISSQKCVLAVLEVVTFKASAPWILGKNALKTYALIWNV